MNTTISPFDFYNPTHIIFGANRFDDLKKNIPKDKKVLILYGGGSVERFGTLDKVREALSDYTTAEFGGIEANPTYGTLSKAVDLIKKEGYDFLLAVGGGSVIDGTKFIAANALFEGEPLEMFKNPSSITKALPFGTIVTLPATGSEMNHLAVITFEKTKSKISFASPFVFPQFSILDPTLTYTLPRKQLANGVADAFIHIIEQYLTYPVGALLQDAYAESLLKILIEQAPLIIDEKNHDYNTRANFMWIATNALNGTLSTGVPEDWASHILGHQITALYNVDHGESLTIILPALLEVRRAEKHDKLLQYAKKVWNISVGTDEEIITAAINKTQKFFVSLGLATCLRDLEVREFAPDLLTDLLKSNGFTHLSERGDQTLEISHEIYQKAW